MMDYDFNHRLARVGLAMMIQSVRAAEYQSSVWRDGKPVAWGLPARVRLDRKAARVRLGRKADRARFRIDSTLRRLADKIGWIDATWCVATQYGEGQASRAVWGGPLVVLTDTETGVTLHVHKRTLTGAVR